MSQPQPQQGAVSCRAAGALWYRYSAEVGLDSGQSGTRQLACLWSLSSCWTQAPLGEHYDLTQTQQFQSGHILLSAGWHLLGHIGQCPAGMQDGGRVQASCSPDRWLIDSQGESLRQSLPCLCSAAQGKAGNDSHKQVTFMPDTPRAGKRWSQSKQHWPA